jgi:hypothetical protein
MAEKLHVYVYHQFYLLLLISIEFNRVTPEKLYSEVFVFIDEMPIPLKSPPESGGNRHSIPEEVATP